MKEKIKKIIIPIFVSVISGCICGRVVYSIYDDKTTLSINNNVIYLLQSGAYSTYDSMRANTMNNNYIYYEDDGLFKTIIGLTGNINNIDKIKQIYKEEIIIQKYYLEDNKIYQQLNNLDKKLSVANTKEEIQTIVNNMINIYKEEKISLLEIN